MSIRPIAFNLADLSVDVWHDEADHGGTVADTAIRFNQNTMGTDTLSIRIPCPFVGCTAISAHPIGGGAMPDDIQRLFLILYRRRAAALGIPAGQQTRAAIKARVKALIAAQDGPHRFIQDGLDDAQF